MMYSRFLTCALLLSFETFCQALVNVTATFVAGSSSFNAPVAFGSPGIASPTATPGGREGHCTATSKSGVDTLYLFGGNMASYAGVASDFWMLDISSAWWTTIHSFQAQHVGTQGVWDSSVFPGSKYCAVCTISAFDPTFYLFGGISSQAENYLWSYIFAIHQWAWLKGSPSGSVSSAGFRIESDSNTPSARAKSSLTASNILHSLIMFGGLNGTDFWNDLWQFNLTSRRWSWISGDISQSNLNSHYDIQRFLDPSYYPASTHSHSAAFIDGNDNFYTFGGVYKSSSLSNDLWMFSTDLGQWMFISNAFYTGSFTTPPLYPGIIAAQTMRAIPGTSLLVVSYGFGQCPQGYVTGLNDIWVYDSSSNVWSWIAGETTTAYIPAGRYFCSADFARSTLVVYGGTFADGSGYNFRSDVWYLTFSAWPPSSTSVSLSQTKTSTAALMPTTYVAATTSTNIQTSTTTALMQSSSIAPTMSANIQTASSKPQTSTSKSTITSSVVALSSPSSSTSYDASTSQVENKPVVSVITRQQHVDVIPSSTLLTKNVSNSTNFESILQSNIVIMSVAIVATLAIIVIACLTLRWRHSRKLELNYFSATLADNEMMMTSMSQLTNTVDAGQTEFSTPGFLNFEARDAFRKRVSLAKGGGGEIFLADALIPDLSEFGTTFALKVIAPRRSSMTPKMVQAFDQEVSVMHYLSRHPNIAKILGWCDEPVAIMMKFYPLGSLMQAIESGVIANMYVKLGTLMDLTSALNFMHETHVAHCDMKPANILVETDRSGRLHCVITDFGICQVYSVNLVDAFQYANLRGASIKYAALEVVSRLRNNLPCSQELAFAGDVYSMAMIVYAVLHGVEGW